MAPRTVVARLRTRSRLEKVREGQGQSHLVVLEALGQEELELGGRECLRGPRSHMVR